MERNSIGGRIETLRKSKDETQQQLAEALGVRRETIKQWEANDRQIKAKNLFDLTVHFCTTADYILGITRDNSPRPTDIDQLGLKQTTIDALKFGHFEVFSKYANSRFRIQDIFDILASSNPAQLEFALMNITGAVELARRADILLHEDKSALVFHTPEEDEDAVKCNYIHKCIEDVESEGYAVLPGEMALEYLCDNAANIIRDIIRSGIRNLCFGVAEENLSVEE